MTVDAKPAPTAYEGLTLGSTLDELIAQAAAQGWRQNSQPGGTQVVTVFTTPDHPVKRYKLGYEAGRLIKIEIDYRAADPARLALREQFVETREHDGVWWLADAGRTVLAAISADGKEVRVLHVAVIQDQREAAAMLNMAFGGPPSTAN